MIAAGKSAKFIRVVLTLAVMLLTLGVLARPQRSAQAVDYYLATCNASDFISSYNAAIATTADDAIHLRAGCTYVFSSSVAAELPPVSTAGYLTIYGNGAAMSGAGSYRFISSGSSLPSNSGLSVYDTVLYNFYDVSNASVFHNIGTLRLYNCQISANTTGFVGGAIDSRGVLEIIGSSLTNNVSTREGARSSVTERLLFGARFCMETLQVVAAVQYTSAAVARR